MEERFETFTVLVNRISRSIRRIKNAEMAEFGLRSAQVSCVYYLYLFRGLTATELCEHCEEDKSTVSRALDHLERNGFITCETKGTKRYRSPLYLTEKGEAAGKKAADRISGVLESLDTALSDGERAVFYRALSVVSRELSEVSEGCCGAAENKNSKNREK